MLLGLGAFFAVSAGVRAVIPMPAEFGLRAKLDYFEQHADEFDAVFIGSSRVFRDIRPVLLERELKQAGIEFRSFNFGIGGMEDFEADHILRAVLEVAGERLQWVFIEAGRWDPRSEEETVFMSKRFVEWHTLTNGRALVESIFAFDESMTTRAMLLRKHAALCASRFVANGRGPDLWRSLQGEAGHLANMDKRNLSEAELARGRGWQAIDEEGAGLDGKKWRGQVKNLMAGDTEGATAGRASLRRLPVAAIERQVELVETQVPNLIYLSLPSLRKTTFARTLARLDIYPKYQSYALPSQNPKLYELKHRADSNHLNSTGAARLTKLVARDLLRWIGKTD